MNPENKRNETRRTLIIYLDCIDMKTGEEIGKIIDITGDGFMLLSNSPLELGFSSRFQIILPGSDPFKNKKLTAEGECRWVKKEKPQNLYYMGMSFTEQTTENISIIELLITKIGFSDGQKKIFSKSGDIEYK